MPFLKVLNSSHLHFNSHLKTSPLPLGHCPWSSLGALQTSPELRLWGFLRCSVVSSHHVVHG